MHKKWILAGILLLGGHQGDLQGHCQMPCGIYHDDMVFDRIDQYIETMYKGISVLNNSKNSTIQDFNANCRWVIEKEKASDEAAVLIMQYFLQQKIKGGEPDTTKRLVAAHNLLADLVAIKQNVNLKFVEDFSTEWEKFKLMFHREGYECDMEKIRMKKEALKRAAAVAAHDHDHDHDHDHSHDHDHPHDHDHHH